MRSSPAPSKDVNNAMEAIEEERKRGRPRIQQQQQQPVPFSRLRTPEPVIRKIPIVEKGLIPIMNDYDQEYDLFSTHFGETSTLRISKEACKYVDGIYKSDSLALLSGKIEESKIEFAISRLRSCTGIAITIENFPLSYYTSEQRVLKNSLLKQFGLFALQSLTPLSYICELVGSLVNLKEIGSDPNLLPMFFVPKTEDSMEIDGEKQQLLLPPFVFPVDEGTTFLDSRSFGSYGGRFIRSFCGNPNYDGPCKPNAILKPIVIINNEDQKSYSSIDADINPSILPRSGDAELLSATAKVKFCLFSTRHIESNTEIILEKTQHASLYPCICQGKSDCLISKYLNQYESQSKPAVEGNRQY
jgi:hypothetical protein